MNWPWSELGLPGPSDLAAVRRAYAQRLKTTHPEDDPEGFQRLHEAYQEARRLARQGGGPAARTVPPPSGAREKDGSNKEDAEKSDVPPRDDGYTRAFRQEAQRQAEERERRAVQQREDFFARHPADTLAQAEQLEARWARLEAALIVLDELSDSGASVPEWLSFLHSGIFLTVKGDETFTKGLEDLIQRTPELSGEVKQTLIQTYGLRKRDVPPEWQGLRELLTGVPPQPLTPSPAQPKKPLYKRGGFWFAVVCLALLGSVPLLLNGVKELQERPGREARAQMCRYLEEDLGRRMESLWDGQNWENVYAPWDEPDLTFQAWPDGERDLSSGTRGYATNYGNVLLTQALEEFAESQEAWELKKLDRGGVSGIYGGSPGGYRFQIPLRGQEESVAALGTLMESLEAEPWYQTCQPVYTLELGYRGLVYFTYTSGEPFDGASLLDYYQTQVGPDVCAWLTEKSGLAEADFSGTPYRLEKQGTVELDGKSFWLVRGVEETSGTAVRQYLFEGMYLISVPAETFSPDLKFYQLLSGESFRSSWENLPMFVQIIRK